MGILHGAKTPFPTDSSIPARFAEKVRESPRTIAVIDGDQTLTYTELDQRSNQLAHLLRERGVSTETRVGVLLERGHELVTALLAVLKAGGAYVPVNPDYPRQRQQDMLADADATLVVTADDVQQATAGSRSDALPPTAGPHSLAYILFTSGSTGRPKGVMIEHRSVLRLVCDTNYVDLGPDERIGQVADTSFDVFTFEIWGALLNSGTLCVIPTQAVLAPGELARALASHHITTLFLTSPLFAEVMADRPDTFGGLRNLLVGGDVVSVARARQLLESEPSARPGHFLNAYGPTEATTFATCGPIRSVPADATSIPIGGPIANTSCYVLDADLKPVPDGSTGELFIGGPGVARGYAGRPEETEEHFLPDPFAAQDGMRMYRTGDRVRTLADGTLDFLGRVDNQVKIRGYRVEPGEVEALLNLHPDIRQAAVVTDETTGERRLVAHVVPAEPASTPSGLREFLSGRLPEWMIPSVFMVSPGLPFTASGKVDRAALPPAAEIGPDTAAVAPRTDLERQLATLAADMLGLASVGVTDDFFALGGHSLLAMRLLSRVNDRFAAQVELGDFLYDPTILRLATEVSRDQ